MPNKQRCAETVVNIGRGMFRTKHQCKNEAMEGSKYCFQHRKERMAARGFYWSKRDKKFMSVPPNER